MSSTSTLTQQNRKLARAIIEELRIEKAIERELCANHFYPFVKKFWKVIEPSTPFVDGWHIHAICLHLEAVARFEIQKLIINMPPRHMKSILASVMFPAWVWVKNPERRFIYGSYAESLAIRDSLKTRTVIESDLYQELFAPTWGLSEDQNQKRLFENTASGARLSVGVGGGLTGQGGDFLFIDDPVNAIDASSEPIRQRANEWHDIAFSTRANNPKRYAKLIIMQRLHEKDLTGHVLASEGGYERLILPAKYDPDSELKSKTSLGWVDPRKKKGALLWSERFDEKSIDDMTQTLNSSGESAAEAQMQQDPKAPKGGLFPRDSWKIFEAFPSPVLEYVQFVDAAQKPGLSNDYSVLATWARTVNGFFIVDVYRDKVDMPTLEEITKSYFAKWRPNAVVIEDKAGGSSLIQYLLRNTTIPVLPFDPGQRDKEVRASAATPAVKSGKCHLPKGAAWVQDFIKEHEKFPNASNDDQVDTTSMAVEYFNRKISSDPKVRQL